MSFVWEIQEGEDITLVLCFVTDLQVLFFKYVLEGCTGRWDPQPLLRRRYDKLISPYKIMNQSNIQMPANHVQKLETIQILLIRCWEGERVSLKIRPISIDF